MNRSHHIMKPKKHISHQHGATLVEVLVTMVVVALGLMGTAGLLLASTRFQQTSTMRSEAIHQAEFIIEKMRANNSRLTAAVAAASEETIYVAEEAYEDADSSIDDPECGLNGQSDCTAGEAAQRDLREWRLSLAQALPGGRGSIFPVTAAGGATELSGRRVIVMWREKTELETDTDEALNISREDPACPEPREASVRCLNMWVAP